jgi:uncharacterized membrane protein
MPDERTPSQAGTSSRPPRWYQQTWLTALAGFALGVIMTGAVATVVVNDRTDAAAAAPTTTVSGTPPATGPTTTTGPEDVSIPASCVQAAKLAQQALNAIEDAGRQLSKLDGTGLQQTIDKLQGLQAQLREQATTCQAKTNP